ncbi:hypothetical protein LCGC14_3025190, partial [marine sediment metagenome]
ALAVLFYIQSDDQRKLVVEREEQLAGVKAKLKAARNTEIRDLVDVIARQNVASDVAIKGADDAMKGQYAKGFANVGLTEAVKGLDGLVKGKVERIAELEARIATQADAITEKDSTIANLKSAHATRVTALQKDLTDARADFTTKLATKDAQLDRAVKEKDVIIQQKDQDKTVLAQDKDTLTREVQARDIRIAFLEKKLADTKKGVHPAVIPLRHADGKIAKVLIDEQIVYIDLGTRDNVKPGLPFAVYAKDQPIPTTGKGKASLEVINVGPNTSECRITKAATEDPIVEGDLVANLVYNTSRTYRFVVEGEFDLYGEGRTDPLGNRRVRSLIERFGGKVVDMVSVDTDFVVLGEEPTRPP